MFWWVMGLHRPASQFQSWLPLWGEQPWKPPPILVYFPFTFSFQRESYILHALSYFTNLCEEDLLWSYQMYGFSVDQMDPLCRGKLNSAVLRYPYNRAEGRRHIQGKRGMGVRIGGGGGGGGVPCGT